MYPSLEVLLGGAIGFVLSTCHSVVDHVCALMLLAKQTIFFLATFLGDPFIKGDDLPLGRVAWFSAALRSFTNCFGWVGSLDAPQGFKLPDTLWYHGSTEPILILSVPSDHPEDVAG